MKPDFITDIDWQILKKKYPNNLNDIIKKLNEHYPVQYLIGNVEFINTIIKVDERVLIPRFETEFLVQHTIEKIKKRKIQNPKILELGTGSGCISIALKKNIPCTIKAIDISKKALTLAMENASLNNVTINFYQSDMLKEDLSNYDVIISNPPYVAYDEKVGEETKFEPQNALFAPNKGLYFYEEIIKKISKLVKKPKLIAFEIGMNQKEELEKIINKYLKQAKVSILKDLANKDRYLFIEFE